MGRLSRFSPSCPLPLWSWSCSLVHLSLVRRAVPQLGRGCVLGPVSNSDTWGLSRHEKCLPIRSPSSLFGTYIVAHSMLTISTDRHTSPRPQNYYRWHRAPGPGSSFLAPTSHAVTLRHATGGVPMYIRYTHYIPAYLPRYLSRYWLYT